MPALQQHTGHGGDHHLQLHCGLHGNDSANGSQMQKQLQSHSGLLRNIVSIKRGFNFPCVKSAIYQHPFRKKRNSAELDLLSLDWQV